MAISKILYMKDCGGHFHGKHLKQALDYIMNPEKTQDGKMIGGINCQPDTAFEQMKQTKREFGKIDKRQGYHLIISFKEGEVTPDTAFEITHKFVTEYLGSQYEAVFCVHDNTAHVHSHIVFNSVSFMDGRKFRYEKGDWEKEIQPITNRLCEEYGLSTIDIGDDKKDASEYYREWNEYRDGKFVWKEMIARDLDSCIIQASDFDSFLELLKDKGYEIKQGKYLAVKPPGMGRFRRCKTLGNDYTEERIRERIPVENAIFPEAIEDFKPKIVKSYVKRYRRAKLSGIQKKYYAKLYRIGKLKKKPYSQVWKYRDDIKKMQKLQQQYLFLSNQDIDSIQKLVGYVDQLGELKKDASKEKSRVYRAKEKCKTIFETLEQMEELEPAENSYKNGDVFFVDEHNKWTELEKMLQTEGYNYEEVKKLRMYYKEQIAIASDKERAISKEYNLGKSILKDMLSEEEIALAEEKILITEKEKTKQPSL